MSALNGESLQSATHWPAAQNQAAWEGVWCPAAWPKAQRWFYQVSVDGSQVLTHGLAWCPGKISPRRLGCGLGFDGTIIGEAHKAYKQGSDSANSFWEVSCPFQVEYRASSMKTCVTEEVYSWVSKLPSFFLTHFDGFLSILSTDSTIHAAMAHHEVSALGIFSCKFLFFCVP